MRWSFVLMILLIYQGEVDSRKVKCKHRLGQRVRDGNGDCPERSTWDPYSGCCINSDVREKRHKHLNTMQADHPTDCIYRPLWDETCPDGMGLDRLTQCCISCLKCEQGYEPADNCLEPCKPCPQNHYSDDLEHNERCFQCTDCKSLNRIYKDVCNVTSPATCGPCIEGYREDGTLENEMQPCVKDPIRTTESTKTTTLMHTAVIGSVMPVSSGASKELMNTRGHLQSLYILATVGIAIGLVIGVIVSACLLAIFNEQRRMTGIIADRRTTT